MQIWNQTPKLHKLWQQVSTYHEQLRRLEIKLSIYEKN